MSIIRNRHHEAKITFLRILLISLFFIILFSILLVQVYKLQITNYSHYLAISQKNQKTEVRLMPYRADIIDRNGVALARYEPYYTLSPSNDIGEDDLAMLKKLNIPANQKEQIIHSWQYVALSNHYHHNIVAQHVKRYYPQGAAFAHTLGYTSKTKDNSELPDNDTPYVTGKTGLEAYYNSYLEGLQGNKTKVLNAKREVVDTAISNPPIRSEPLQLTLDSKLQQYIFDQMSGLVGSAVVLDPNSGEVLASVNSPSFDPNRFDKSRLNTQALIADNPMFNRFSQALYPPASIIKPFIALNALEDGVINEDDTIFDPGYYKLNDKSRIFRNHKRSGHGDVNLHKAIVLSNDPYFYDLAYKLGIDKLTLYLTSFGFAKATTKEFTHEATGIVPNKQYRDKHHKKWYDGQTIITGIGQGDLLCTPLQLARATMLLANNGYDYPLHYKESYQKPAKKILSFSEKNRSIILAALEEVTITGTARKMHNKPFLIAGKTGSAQVAELASNTDYHSLPHHQKDHHLFAGFAPSRSPNIVVVVVIEHQHEAVNVANNIFDWCYKNGLIEP